MKIRMLRSAVWTTLAMTGVMIGSLEAQPDGTLDPVRFQLERRAPESLLAQGGPRQQRKPNRAPQARGNGSGKVPPGWCQGVGNPHNTRENCGYDRRDDRRYDRRDDRRIDRRIDRNRAGNNGRSRSYEQDHAIFHRELDRRYDRLSAQRPLDVQYQLELRMRKRAEHDSWHARQGIRH